MATIGATVDVVRRILRAVRPDLGESVSSMIVEVAFRL
jgi:hypothetical protein